MIALLEGHRSIRRYQTRPVDDDTLLTIVRCAQMAPTSCHFQAYTILRVNDAAKRAMLADIAGGQRWLQNAPVVLLFCADLYRASAFYEDIDPRQLQNTEAYTVAVIDASLVGQKALIAAQALGLGGVMVGGIRNNLSAIANAFQLPKLVLPVFALCLGYPDDQPAKKPRLPMDAVLKEDAYVHVSDDARIQDYNRITERYYRERGANDEKLRWTERCGESLMDSHRDSVGAYAREAGFLQRN